MARHRQLPWRVEVPGPGESTLLVIESRTAEGGTLRLMTDVTAVKGREMRLSELAQRNEVLATWSPPFPAASSSATRQGPIIR